MPGPIFIERSLSGLGTSAAAVGVPRTEITEDQWNRQVTAQWEAANTGVVPQLRRQVGYLGMAGFGALAGAAVLGALGKTGFAMPLAAIGVAGVAIGTYTATKAEQVKSGLVIGSQPMAGWRGW